MGLIRKTLAVGTLGVVKGSSKKQRVAKGTLKAIEAQNELLAEHAPTERPSGRVRRVKPPSQEALCRVIPWNQPSSKTPVSPETPHELRTKLRTRNHP